MVNIAKKAWLSTTVFLTLVMLTVNACGASTSSSASPPTSVAPQNPTRSATQPAAPTQNAAHDWTTYHDNNSRAGYIANAPDAHKLTSLWNAQLDGAVYGEPLVVGGHVLVATEGDTLYSLDASTGKVQWHTNVGQPVPLSDLPCGNIDPLGITGTPVYDPVSGLIFAVAEIIGPQHILVGLDVRTGQVKLRRAVDPPGMDPTAQQQRAALALSANMLYIAYGGLDGDCSDYHGWVVASRTDGQGALLSYQVPTTREGGIWATSGPAVDAIGRIFVTVGNGAATQAPWDHSDSVLRLSPSLQLQAGFAPQQWQQDNASDADLGSMGPLPVPGGFIFADGKSGNAYLVNANQPGGIGGQVYQTTLCASFGGSALRDSVIVVPCTDGLRAVHIEPGPSLKVLWHATVGGSPIIGGHTIYTIDQGSLVAINISTGHIITSISVGTTPHFVSPTLSAGRIFVATTSGASAFSIS